MSAAPGPSATSQALLRRQLPAVHEQVTARPKLAEVGVTTYVLDAVKWAA